MKTSEEWGTIIKQSAIVFENNNVLQNIIAEIQREAYNQALEDAAENAKAFDWVQRAYSSCDVDKESILKLKK